MSTELLFIIISMVVNSLVGVILFRQIKSQKEIIESYKGLMEATDPSKIVLLQKEEVEKIKRVASNDIAELKLQVQQLANVAAHSIEMMENHETNHKNTKFSIGFNRNTWINMYLPNCGAVLEATLFERRELYDL